MGVCLFVCLFQFLFFIGQRIKGKESTACVSVLSVKSARAIQAGP